MAPGQINVGTPAISFDGDLARWSVTVDHPRLPAELWFTVPAEDSDLLSDRADAALIALLAPAMRLGVDIHVKGTLTDELLRWLDEHVQGLVRTVISHHVKVAITADRAEAVGPQAAGVAMGFSAGVDSFAALDQAKGHPAHMRLTHLLLNNVGAHGSGDAARRAFRQHAARTRPLATTLGLPLVEVDSNLDDLYQTGLTHTAFGNTHTLRNAAVAHLLAGGVGRWYYASSGHLSFIHTRPSGHLASVDAILLPLLSTDALRLHSAVMDDWRVDKIARIAGDALVQHHLDVCVTPALAPAGSPNCSRCWKCMRTMLTLDMLGRLDDFSVFDRGTYEQHLSEYAVTLLASDGVLDGEVKKLGDLTGWSWPTEVRLRARARRAQSSMLRTARTVKRRLSI